MLNKIKLYIKSSKYFRNELFRRGFIDSNYYLFAQAGSKIITLLIIPLLTRALTLNEFAEYDKFLLFVGFMSLIVGLGMDAGLGIIISENKENNDVISYLFTRSLLVVLLVILSLWGIFYIAQHYIFLKVISYKLLNYSFLYLLFSYFTYAVFNFLKWLGRAKIASIVSFFSASLGVLFGVVFLFLGHQRTLSKYILGLVLGSFIGVILSFAISKDLLKFHNSPKKGVFRDFLRVSLPYIPTYLSSYLLNYSDRIIIMTFLSDRDYAIYALAARFSSLPNFLINIFMKGFQPIIYLNIRQNEGKVFAKKVFHAYLTFIIPFLLLLCIFAHPLVAILGGAKFAGSASILPIVVLATVISGTMSFNGFGYPVKRKTIYIPYILFSVIVLNLLLSYELVRYFQLPGVAMGTLLAAVVGACFYTYFSEKLFPIGYNSKLILATYFGSLLISLFFLNV